MVLERGISSLPCQKHGEAQQQASDTMKKRTPRGGADSRQRGRRSRREQLAILYEDDAVIAVNKPAGLPSVPVPGSEMPSAWSLVSAQLKANRQKAFVVHRIDRFTSGIMLFAKTERDRDNLVRQFLAHTPDREYLAVIRGQLEPQEGTLVHYFRKAGMFQKLSRANDRDAARAELKYSVERVLRVACLVRAALVTGLQNQIRVQFSAVGHPVIGDRKYHPAEAEERRIDRVALHAARLGFDHPRSGKSVLLDCEPPQDFRRLVQALSNSKSPRH
jgi:23S rRNA pseudouridine1911/1915/1917 synthase